MTETEKQQFQWLTERLHELAYASAIPATQPIAAALIPMLANEAAAAFSSVGDVFKQMQKQAAQLVAAKMVSDGPGAWKRLHTRALSPVADPSVELRWLTTDFPKDVPCGECKRFYFQYLQDQKPDFTDYFAWTVQLHNAVNRKLTPPKPEMTVEAARALWTKGG